MRVPIKNTQNKAKFILKAFWEKINAVIKQTRTLKSFAVKNIISSLFQLLFSGGKKVFALRRKTVILEKFSFFFPC